MTFYSLLSIFSLQHCSVVILLWRWGSVADGTKRLVTKLKQCGDNNNEMFLIFDHLPLSSEQASLTPHVTPHLGEAALADAGLSHC